MTDGPRILFAMAHAGFFRNFESTINHLIHAGFEVDLVFSRKHKAIELKDYPALRSRKLRVIPAKFVDIPEMKAVYRNRVHRDVLFYANEEFRDASHLRARFPEHQKGHISSVRYRLLLGWYRALSRQARRRLEARYEAMEQAAPPHPVALKVLHDVRPDLVVVSPLVHFFTNEIEFVKAAKQLGIPTVLPVASWDNLTNKGIAKSKPDLVAVWNEAMAEEAVRLHGFARENVVITGATVFDWWYDKGDLWDKDRFYTEAGLPAATSEDSATLLYLCSSVSIAGGSEVAVVEKWVKAVRQSDDPRLRNARILVRLHPMNRQPWAAKLAELHAKNPAARDYTIFPYHVQHPTSAEQQAYFLNSVHHADAIVGLNTSAMIEAAIKGKPVLTFKGHGAEASQVKNLHFRHLVESGCVRVSETLSAHVSALSSVLDETETVAAAARGFVSRFVRPRGLEVETAKCLSDEIRAFLARRPPNTLTSFLESPALMKKTPPKRPLIKRLIQRVAGPVKQKASILMDSHVRVYRKSYFDTGGKPLPLAVEFLKAMKEEQRPEVLMFGDSVSLRVANQDFDRRTLGQMIADSLAPRRTCVTSFSAYTAYMYGAFLGLARRLELRPDWVILPFNLRCTSPQWDACPIWQYTQEHAVVQALIANPEAKPGAVAGVPLDEKIYRAVAFSSPLSRWRTVGDFRAEAFQKSKKPKLALARLKHLLALHYGAPIYGPHRQHAFLAGAINEAQAMGAKVLVYLTPVNVEFMSELWGADLLSVVAHNRQRVREVVERAAHGGSGVVFEDWADTLPADHFFHEQETTEHLAEAGRLRLAEMIAQKVGGNQVTFTELTTRPNTHREASPAPYAASVHGTSGG